MAESGTFRRRYWPHLRRILTFMFFAVVAWLLISRARSIDWVEVMDSIARYDARTLALAGALTALSFAIYSSYDLLSKIQIRHPVSKKLSVLIAFVSYAFNLNLGALIGGMAFRFRLYARFGLTAPKIARIVGFSVFTNWSGYVLVLGLLLIFHPLELPAGWPIRPTHLVPIGMTLLLAVLAFIGLSAFSKKRVWRFREHEFVLPKAGMAFAQVALSSSNWLVIGGIIHLLLGGAASYFTVMTVFLLSGLAAVLVHIPAGLGVLEAVFITLLGHQIPATRILAGLLAYRGIYYLMPLMVAAVVYLIMELRTGRKPTRVPPDQAPPLDESTSPPGYGRV
jgi:glycosyltransferase 2 family protein